MKTAMLVVAALLIGAPAMINPVSAKPFSVFEHTIHQKFVAACKDKKPGTMVIVNGLEMHCK